MLQGNRIGWSYAILTECDSVSWNAIVYKNVSLLFITLNYRCWIVCSCPIINPINRYGLKRLPGRLVNVLHRCCFLIWGIRNRLNVIRRTFSYIINRCWSRCTWSITRNRWWFNCWEIIAWACNCPWRIRDCSSDFVFRCRPVECNWSSCVWSSLLSVTVYVMNRLRYRVLQIKSIWIWRRKGFRCFLQVNLVVLYNAVFAEDCPVCRVIIAD